MSSIHSFINKVCASTDDPTIEQLDGIDRGNAEYNPLAERQAHFSDRGVLLQSVKKGEALLEGHFSMT